MTVTDWPGALYVAAAVCLAVLAIVEVQLRRQDAERRRRERRRDLEIIRRRVVRERRRM